jgi:hypothetical protein
LVCPKEHNQTYQQQAFNLLTSLEWATNRTGSSLQGHSVQQLSLHAATDDRCANFSASTCPTQLLELIASSTADKLPLEKFHRLLDLAFWGGETSKNINTVSNSL